jgi:hypothetical protein
MTLALEEGGWKVLRPGRFIPGKDPVPIVQDAEWSPEPVWTCAKNLAPTGIFFRSPDRPSRSQSLYQLSYPSPCRQRARVYVFVLCFVVQLRNVKQQNAPFPT